MTAETMTEAPLPNPVMSHSGRLGEAVDEVG